MVAEQGAGAALADLSQLSNEDLARLIEDRVTRGAAIGAAASREAARRLRAMP